MQRSRADRVDREAHLGHQPEYNEVGRGLVPRRPIRASGEREPHHGGRPTARTAVERERAAERSHDAVADREAEPGALVAVARDERFEDALAEVFRDPEARAPD